MRKVLTVVLAAVLNLQSADPAELGMDPDRLARISARMKQFVQEGRIAGAVMLLARHDRIALLEAVGYQDLEAKKPMRVDTIFRVASIAKPVTVTGAMMLQENGLLTINDIVVRHLPEFRNLRMDSGARPSRPLTIRQLMTHTSGMAIERDAYKGGVMKMPLSEIAAMLAETPLASEPGTKWAYSSPGIDTLGRVIEVVSGKSFEAFIEERIFSPLGMKDSGFFLSPRGRARLASFYRFSDGKLQHGAVPNTYAGDHHREGRRNPGPAFGLYSAAPDLGALLQMMLNRGTYDGRRLLSPASVKAMTTNQLPEELGVKWGLGWSVASGPGRVGGPLGSATAFGHNGSTGVSVWADPGRDLAGVFLIHQAGWESRHVRNVFMAMATAAVVD
jgi:CubicO group peptidase (beta-lactamase class C family)